MEQKVDIITSSGKIIGYVQFDDLKIIINNFNKPILEISDEILINGIKNKSDDSIIILYDEYTLTIAEIAALFKCSYYMMNQIIKKLNVQSAKKQGRRNSSYGIDFSEQRKENISNSHKGKSPSTPPYIRTKDIRDRISKTLKEGHASGRIKVNAEAISKAWKDGKYSNAPMGRGIQGYIHASKSTRDTGDLYFRSLLELFYILKIKEDSSVTSIINEPIHIKLKDGGIYIPDFLVNNTDLVELKPKNHYLWTKDCEDDRFEKEVMGAKQYCSENGLTFKIIYDTDIQFESGKFKKYLLSNPEIIEKYNIRFNKPLK